MKTAASSIHRNNLATGSIASLRGFAAESDLASPYTTVRRLWQDVRQERAVESTQHPAITDQALRLGRREPEDHRFGDYLAIQSVALILEDDTLNASAVAAQALRRGASGECAHFATLALRFCEWKAGAAPISGDAGTFAALQTIGWGRQASPSALLANVLDLSLASAIEFSKLQTQSAERLARCALRAAQGSSSLSATPAAMLALILYEQGQLDEANRLLEQHLEDIRSVCGVDCVSNAFVILARIAAHRGDEASVLAYLNDGRDLADARDWPRLQSALLLERIRLCEPGDDQRAAGWLAQLDNLSATHRSEAPSARSEIDKHLYEAQLHAYLIFGCGPCPQAALANLRHEAWLSQDLRTLAFVKLAEAQLLWIEGNESEGLETLTGALKVAEAAGLRRRFADAGPILPIMMNQVLQTGGLEPGLLSFALCAADGLRGAQSDQRSVRRRSRTCQDGLTAREQDVLSLIGEGRTNKVIAQIQGVSPETVKTHVKNIFYKLGVERRSQAVYKAQRLGLIAQKH